MSPLVKVALSCVALVPFAYACTLGVYAVASTRPEVASQPRNGVEARRVIEAIDSALTQDGESLLSADELAQIRQRRDALEAALESAAVDELKSLIGAVEQASEVYVARRMNASVKKALAGKQIDEVDV